MTPTRNTSPWDDDRDQTGDGPVENPVRGGEVEAVPESAMLCAPLPNRPQLETATDDRIPQPAGKQHPSDRLDRDIGHISELRPAPIVALPGERVQPRLRGGRPGAGALELRRLGSGASPIPG